VRSSGGQGAGRALLQRAAAGGGSAGAQQTGSSSASRRASRQVREGVPPVAAAAGAPPPSRCWWLFRELPSSCSIAFNNAPFFCRRQLRTCALLGELDLPAAAGSLQASLPHLAHLPAAAAHQLAGLASHPGVAHDTLAQLLALGDAAAQRIADLADAAAAAAEPAKKDNGWLQPLVTALETVLTFIEVQAVGNCFLVPCTHWQQRWSAGHSFVPSPSAYPSSRCGPSSPQPRPFCPLHLCRTA